MMLHKPLALTIRCRCPKKSRVTTTVKAIDSLVFCSRGGGEPFKEVKTSEKAMDSLVFYLVCQFRG